MMDPEQPLNLFDNLHEATFIFVVANSLSGGNAAKELLQTGFNFVSFDHVDSETGAETPINIFISDISRGSPGNKDVFHIIHGIASAKFALDPHSVKVRVVVAGGDGTVRWCLGELEAHHVQPESALVGVLPLGTGNDFAHALGAKLEPKHPHESPVDWLKRMAVTWMSWVPAGFDVWHTTVELNEGGTLQQVKSGSRKKVILQDRLGAPLRVLESPMVNYFSCGVESRIGVGFDRHRVNDPILNKGAYLVEGFKKIAFHRTRFLNNMITGLFTDDPTFGHEQVFRCTPKFSRSDRFARLLQRVGGKAVVPPRLVVDCPTDREESSETEQENEGPRRCNSAADHPSQLADQLPTALSLQYSRYVAKLLPCVSLVFLNVPSFAGGLDLWASAQGKLGVQMPHALISPLQTHMRQVATNAKPQCFGDGRLEILGFQSLLELSMSNLQRFLPVRQWPRFGNISTAGNLDLIGFTSPPGRWPLRDPVSRGPVSHPQSILPSRRRVLYRHFGETVSHAMEATRHNNCLVRMILKPAGKVRVLIQRPAVETPPSSTSISS